MYLQSSQINCSDIALDVKNTMSRWILKSSLTLSVLRLILVRKTLLNPEKWEEILFQNRCAKDFLYTERSIKITEYTKTKSKFQLHADSDLNVKTWMLSNFMCCHVGSAPKKVPLTMRRKGWTQKNYHESDFCKFPWQKQILYASCRKAITHGSTTLVAIY